MGDNEFVKKYREGTIHRSVAGKFTFYNWVIYLDTVAGGPKQRLSFTSQEIEKVQELADIALDQRGHGEK